MLRSTAKSAARFSSSTLGAPVDDRSTVLFAVTGMSPAVLTETVWALATGTPSVVPSRVVVVTTEAGRICLERELFVTPIGAHPNVWTALHHELSARGLDVSAKLHLDRRNGIRVFSRPGPAPGETTPLDDIRTAADNELAGDFLLQELRGFTDDDDTRVIASIAGGRKTMGALLYAVMTLAGRDTDRLTQVLVEEPFDNPRLQPKFYFPAQPGDIPKLPDGKSANSSSTKIELADVPFVPLREVFPRELGRRPGRFMALVNRYRLSTPMVAVRTLHLAIFEKSTCITLDGDELNLDAKQHALLHFLAGRAISGQLSLDDHKAAIVPLRRHLMTLIAGLEAEPGKGEEYALLKRKQKLQEFVRALDSNEFSHAISKILDDLKARLKRSGGSFLRLLNTLPVEGRFSLKLPPEAITIVE